jgi:Fe-S oxidoreductase
MLQFQIDFRFFFTILVVAVPAFVAWPHFKKIIQLVKLGKAENLFGDWGARTNGFLQNFILQRKMFKDFAPGFAHSLIFFGFIVVTLGSAEHIIEGLIHGFNFSWLLGPLYGPLIYVQDVFLAFINFSVVYFLVRRLITKPKRMSTDPRHQRDGKIVLAFTAGHMVANLLAFALFIAAGDTVHAMPEWRPVSNALGQWFASLGWGGEATMSWGWIFWGIHIATVGGFLMYIPHSKHLHIMSAAPNIFFARLEPKGGLSKINFEDETQTQFGVAKLSDFSWKDILDSYTCTTCGRCNEFCPTSNTGKPLQPMKLIDDIKRYSKVQSEKLLKGEDVSYALISEESGITHETIWACTTCRACVEACPVMIEHVDKIVDLRRNLVLMEGNMPPELQVTMKNWETQSNPWGMPSDSRDEWARAMNIPTFAEKPGAEYLFYVGCAGSFNDRNKKITVAFAKILQKAGVDFAILGKEELCNGETARRAGNEYLAKTMIEANIEVLKRHKVKKILATCPHCFNTLKNEYPDFGFQAEEVLHHTDFIDRLVQQGKLVPQEGHGAEKIKVAFHDSCYLGRYNEVYEEPRNALKAFGAELVEMPRNRKTGLCCGAGGARMWLEETIGKRINVERVEEALELTPQVIAAGCPFCQVMLTDGVNGKNKGEQVQVLDVAEIIASRIGS